VKNSRWLMAKKEKTPSPASHSRWREIVGVALVAVGLFFLLALVSYSPQDSSLNSTGTGQSQAINMGGSVGAFLADLSIQTLGWAAYTIPIFFLFLGVTRFFHRNWGSWALRSAGAVLLVLMLCVLVQLRLGPITFTGGKGPAGGIIGQLAVEGLIPFFNVAGAHVIVLALLLAAVLIMTNLSLGTAVAWGAGLLGGLFTLVTKKRERTRRKKVVSRAQEKEKKVKPPKIENKPAVVNKTRVATPRQESFDTIPRPRGKFSLPPLHLRRVFFSEYMNF
jgi:DNA segregation ATPase FtsK/SpoIIIE-like protein